MSAQSKTEAYIAKVFNQKTVPKKIRESPEFKALMVGELNDRMDRAVKSMTGFINRSAGRSIPYPSIRSDIASIHETSRSVRSTGRTGVVMMGFDQATRESLYPPGYPAGAWDIISLYNKGFTVRKKRVAFKKLDNKTVIHGRRHLPASNFIQDAIGRFNSGFGAKNHVVATYKDSSKRGSGGGSYGGGDE